MTSRSESRRCNPWTKQETQQLEFLAGNMPVVLLVKRYNKWALKQKLPSRTSISIRRYAERIGVSLRCNGGEVLTIRDVERLLGISAERLYRWQKLDKISIRRYGRKPYVIRAELIRMAKDHPYLLRGISSADLYQLLESEQLVEYVLTSQEVQVGPRGQRRIKCLETSQIWPSIASAGRAVHRSATSLSNAARSGQRSAGRRWQLVA